MRDDSKLLDAVLNIADWCAKHKISEPTVIFEFPTERALQDANRAMRHENKAGLFIPDEQAFPGRFKFCGLNCKMVTREKRSIEKPGRYDYGPKF